MKTKGICRSRKGIHIVRFVTFLALAGVPLSHADPADYDLGFRGDGSGDDANGTAPTGNGVAVDSQGRIVVVGTAMGPTDTDISVIRYLPDGSLDTSFGTGGKLLFDFGRPERGAAVAIDASDNIVVVADIQYATQKDILIMRLLGGGATPGAFDPNFSGGIQVFNGIDLGISNSADDIAAAVVIDAAGKIVVGGSTLNAVSATSSYDFTVLRYLPDGSFDPAFNGGNATFIDQYGANYIEILTGLAIDSLGRIFLCGNTDTWCGVIRLTSAGVPDPAIFGDGIYNWLDGNSIEEPQGTQIWSTGIAVDPNDGIVVCGNQAGGAITGQKLFVAHFPKDDSFNDWVTQEDFGGTTENANAVAIQTDGKIAVAGYSSNGPGLAVIRYNADGTRDTSFAAPDGGFADNPTGQPGEVIRGVAIQGDSKIVLAGSHVTEFVVARLMGNFDTWTVWYGYANTYYSYYAGIGYWNYALAYYYYYLALGDYYYYSAYNEPALALYQYYVGIGNYYNSLYGGNTGTYYLYLYYAYAYYYYYLTLGDGSSANQWFNYFYGVAVLYL